MSRRSICEPLSQGGLLVRFAMLGSMAYVLAETPATGSAGTSLERPCTDPHWGFVIEGELIVVRGGRRETIVPGRAFHVPAGDPPHHFETTARSLIAGFAPVDPALDLSDGTLAAQGFNVVADRSPAIVVPAVTRVEVPRRHDPERIVADVGLRPEPGPDGRAERLPRRLVRCAPLGDRDLGRAWRSSSRTMSRSSPQVTSSTARQAPPATAPRPPTPPPFST